MRKSGITKTTPNDFLLNAGVVFKNFRWVWRKATEAEVTAGNTIKIVADGTKETDSKVESTLTCQSLFCIFGIRSSRYSE